MNDRKFEVGKTYKLRNGLDYKVLHISGNPSTEDCVIIGVTKEANGKGIFLSHYFDGKYYATRNHEYDVIPPEPEKKYRPFEGEELLSLLNRVVRHKGNFWCRVITDANSKTNAISTSCFALLPPAILLEDYTFEDGTPCGVEVTE